MKKYEPKISIIIPMYNSEKYIEETISSFLQQTYKEIEIIVVDDGSIDNSASIIKKNYSDDVKYIYQMNNGAPSARNNGLQQATGEYIIFFDADDIMDINGIQILVENSQGGNADLIFGKYKLIDNDSKFMGIGGNERFLKYVDWNDSIENQLGILANLSAFPGSKMYRRQFLIDNQLNFNDLKIGQDLNFLLNVLAYYPAFNIVSNPVCSYRIHEGSISTSISDSILDIINCFKEIELKKYELYENNSAILETLKFNHYGIQLYKTPNFKNKKHRYRINRILAEEINKININQINQNLLLVNMLKVRLVAKFHKLYGNELAIKFLTRK